MGKATLSAVEQVVKIPNVKMQKGSLVIKDPAKNTYVTFIQEELASSGKHIEVSLFNQMKKNYNQNFSRIPNNATLIFYNPWSPCTHCTSKSIPEMAEVLELPKRGLKVKFKFAEYYTASAWKGAGGNPFKGQELFWKSAEEAKTAYKALAERFGVGKMKDVPYRGELDDGLIARRTLSYPSLSFGKANEKTAPVSEFVSIFG